MKQTAAILSTLTIAISSSLSAGVFESLSSQFNAIIFGNFTGSGADTEGRQLTAGDMTVNVGSYLYTVGEAVVAPDLPYSPGRHDLIVGGNFKGRAYVMTESAYVGGSLDYTGSTDTTIEVNPNYTTGSYYSSGTGTVTTNAGAFDIDLATGQAVASGSGISLDDALTATRAESLMFAGLENTEGAILSDNGYGTIGITFSGIHDIYVYTVSDEVWNGNKSRTINAPANATVIINVTGENINLTYGDMNVVGTDLGNVIINYQEATSIALTSMDHNGAILAPNASYTQTGGGVNGAVIIGGDAAKDGGGEFHNHLFTGDLSAIPEVQSYSLLLALLSATGVAARRKR